MAKAIATEMGILQSQAREIVQRVFDRITETLVQEGRIVERGTHGQLMGRDGLYRKLSETQSTDNGS